MQDISKYLDDMSLSLDGSMKPKINHNSDDEYDDDFLATADDYERQTATILKQIANNTPSNASKQVSNDVHIEIDAGALYTDDFDDAVADTAVAEDIEIGEEYGSNKENRSKELKDASIVEENADADMDEYTDDFDANSPPSKKQLAVAVWNPEEVDEIDKYEDNWLEDILEDEFEKLQTEHLNVISSQESIHENIEDGPIDFDTTLNQPTMKCGVQAAVVSNPPIGSASSNVRVKEQTKVAPSADINLGFSATQGSQVFDPEIDSSHPEPKNTGSGSINDIEASQNAVDFLANSHVKHETAGTAPKRSSIDNLRTAVLDSRSNGDRDQVEGSFLTEILISEKPDSTTAPKIPSSDTTNEPFAQRQVTNKLHKRPQSASALQQITKPPPKPSIPRNTAARPQSANRPNIRSNNVINRPASASASPSHAVAKFWPFLHTSTDTAHTNPANTRLVSSKVANILCGLLDTLRRKATSATEIIESADSMWRHRVEDAHSKLMQGLKARHEEEVERFKRNRLRLIGTKDITVHAVRVHGAHVGGHHAVHVSDMHTDTSLSRINNMKNKLLERHELEEARAAVDLNTPIKQLDNLKAKICSHIEFCVVRAERSVEHFVRSDLAASQNKACEMLKLRSDLAKGSAYSIIRQSLTSLVNICAKIPTYYSIVNDAPPTDDFKPNLTSLEKFILKISQEAFLKQLADDTCIDIEESHPCEDQTHKKTVKKLKKKKKKQKSEGGYKYKGIDSIPRETAAALEPLPQSEPDYDTEDFIVDYDAADDDYDDDIGEEWEYAREQTDQKVTPTMQRADSPLHYDKKHHRMTVTEAITVRDSVVTAQGMFKDLGVDTTKYMRGILGQGRVIARRKSAKTCKTIVCPNCAKKFSGAGKTIPSMTEQVKEYIASKKLQEKRFILGQLRTDNMTITERNNAEAKALLLVRQKENEARQFCSWECVKSWTVSNVPLQQRYNTLLLIDLVAGYVV